MLYSVILPVICGSRHSLAVCNYQGGHKVRFYEVWKKNISAEHICDWKEMVLKTATILFALIQTLVRSLHIFWKEMHVCSVVIHILEFIETIGTIIYVNWSRCVESFYLQMVNMCSKLISLNFRWRNKFIKFLLLFLHTCRWNCV